MKLLYTFFMLIILSSPSFAGVNAVATLPWIGSIAKEIGGDKVNVTVLVKPAQDPHFVEAKPGMILAASKADLLIYNGLDLEVGYLPLIVNSSRNVRIQPGQPGNLDLSRQIHAIEKATGDIDRSMGDVHPMGNPHYHLSPANIMKAAEGVAAALSAIEPSNAVYYSDNLQSFDLRLKERQRQWSGLLKGKRFIAFHKYFEYLAKEFGFEIVGYIEPKPGIPPSSGHIGRLIETINRTKPDAIISTAYYGKKEVDFLASKTGVKGVVVPHDVGCLKGIDDWFVLMDRVVEALK